MLSFKEGNEMESKSFSSEIKEAEVKMVGVLATTAVGRLSVASGGKVSA